VLGHRRAGEQDGVALPFVEFSVPIAKGETAATVVSAGREINKYLVVKIGAGTLFRP
jgi:hypothetical protein